MVTIIGLIVGLIGKFGVDHIVQSKLTEASTTLREGFRNELADAFQNLRDSNTAQVKQLEDALTKRIDQANADLKLKSDCQFQFAQGLAFLGDQKYDQARHHFRNALAMYILGKVRQSVEKEAAETALANLFWSYWREDGDHYLENAKRELAYFLYNDLEDELNTVALRLEWLVPLVRDRKPGAPVSQPSTQAAPSGTPLEKAHSGTAPAPPNKPTTR